MITILLILLVAIGAIVYVVSEKPKPARPGEILYFVALFALLVVNDPFKLLK